MVEYGVDRIHRGMPTPYKVDDVDKPRALPDGMAAVGRHDPGSGLESVTVGSNSASTSLVLTVQDLKVTLDPSAGTVKWDSDVHTLNGTIQDFSSWTVTHADPQVVKADLGGGLTVEAYAIGMIRFKGLGTRLTFTTTVLETLETEAIHLDLISTKGWFIASTKPFSISTTGKLTSTGDIFPFFHLDEYREIYEALLHIDDDRDLEIGETNTSRLLGTFAQFYWARVRWELKEILKQGILATATAGSLNRHAKFAGLARKDNESDADFRLRIYGELRLRRGGTTVDDILEFVASLLDTDVSNITIEETADETTGGYKGAYFLVKFDFDLLRNLGYTSDQFSAVIDSINDLLERASAAGVFAKVRPIGGATWDTATWDDTDAVYGA